jgi:hypothetical protein
MTDTSRCRSALHVLKSEIPISAGYIDRIGEQAVFLKLMKAAVEQLPHEQARPGPALLGQREMAEVPVLAGARAKQAQ